MNETKQNASMPDEPPLGNNGLFPIRTVARLTGINPITLRAWERRHNLIRPIRTPSGHRLYSTADIELIRRIQSLSEQGMGFSQIGIVLKREARLAERKQTNKSGASEERFAAPPPARSTTASGGIRRGASAAVEAPSDTPPTLDALRAHVRQAAIALDADALQQIERKLLLWYPPETMIRLFLIDALHELERREIWPDQNLVRHWLSAEILRRIDGLLHLQPTSSGQIIAVDAIDTDGFLRAVEFGLILALAERFTIHLIPQTFPDALRVRLIARWNITHWVRLQRMDNHAYQTPATPNTIRIHRCLLMEGETPVEITETGLFRGSAHHCLSHLTEQLHP